MAARELHFELLLNRRVFAMNGRAIGRLEEVRAEPRGSGLFVTEYLVGSYALFERLASAAIGRSILHTLRLAKKGNGYRVAWQQLDLSDPLRPVLRCAVGELAPLDPDAERR
jgi:sporulation protein YlmC with PRC-barrel domain